MTDPDFLKDHALSLKHKEWEIGSVESEGETCPAVRSTQDKTVYYFKQDPTAEDDDPKFNIAAIPAVDDPSGFSFYELLHELPDAVKKDLAEKSGSLAQELRAFFTEIASWVVDKEEQCKPLEHAADLQFNDELWSVLGQHAPMGDVGSYILIAAQWKDSGELDTGYTLYPMTQNNVCTDLVIYDQNEREASFDELPTPVRQQVDRLLLEVAGKMRLGVAPELRARLTLPDPEEMERIQETGGVERLPLPDIDPPRIYSGFLKSEGLTNGAGIWSLETMVETLAATQLFPQSDYVDLQDKEAVFLRTYVTRMHPLAQFSVRLDGTEYSDNIERNDPAAEEGYQNVIITLTFPTVRNISLADFINLAPSHVRCAVMEEFETMGLPIAPELVQLIKAPNAHERVAAHLKQSRGSASQMER